MGGIPRGFEKIVGIRRILLKNWEGIRVLGKVFEYFFDFLKMFEYFFECFRILWDPLEYFEILRGIRPMKKMEYQRAFTSG